DPAAQLGGGGLGLGDPTLRRAERLGGGGDELAQVRLVPLRIGARPDRLELRAQFLHHRADAVLELAGAPRQRLARLAVPDGLRRLAVARLPLRLERGHQLALDVALACELPREPPLGLALL